MGAYPMITRLSRRRAVAGFTLIELLIVILIIGILVAIGVPAYLKYTAAANDRDAQSALRTAYKAAIAGDTEVNTGRFPLATTVVNDIQADEPGVSVARGSCLGGLGSASTKQVLVDPASTTSQITLCTVSASGAVWKLSGTLTGNPTVSDASTVALTFSATNAEITDARRAEGTSSPSPGHSYDGLTNDSSTGIWESTTNLVPNGGFELGTTGWIPIGSASMTWTTAQAKFGSHSIDISFSGVSSSDGARWSLGTINAGTTLTASAWVYAPPASVGTTVDIRLRDSTPAQQVTAQTLVAGWQRTSVTWTAPNTATMVMDVYDSPGAGHAWDVYVDGVQVEQKPFATPYVETTTVNQTRQAAFVQAPAALLDSSQGWVAMRVRMPFASSQNYGLGNGFQQPNMFSLTNGTLTNRIHIFWYSGSTAWNIIVNRGGTSVQIPAGSGNTFSAGAILTVIGKWTSSQAGISINGAAFTTQPVGAGTWNPSNVKLTIGGWNGGVDGYQADSDFLWFACGAGTLSDADAATINGFGNSDPKRSSFPSSAQATMVWDGTSTVGSLK